MIQGIFKKPLYDYINPDEAVSVGAALQGGIISGQISNLILIDVINLSLGVETLGGLMRTIIKKNSSIPVESFQVFSTSKNLQKNVIINILQGEHIFAHKNKSLGKFLLSEIPLTKKGIPKIKISFNLDINSLLTINAKEDQTGNSKFIKIKSF